MIAQEDTELFEWLHFAARRGGDFISNLATAALHADGENYPILRPALLVIAKKYPKYSSERLA